MSQVLFTNVNVFDATGEMPYPGEVLVEATKLSASPERIKVCGTCP